MVAGLRLVPLGLAHGRVAALGASESDGGAEHPPRAGAIRAARRSAESIFVRELSRLLAVDDVLTEAGAARTGVPATVKDVVCGRLAALADVAQRLLRIAALIGRDFEIPPLAGCAGLDVETCLGLLESMEGLGLIEP